MKSYWDPSSQPFSDDELGGDAAVVLTAMLGFREGIEIEIVLFDKESPL